MHIDSFKVQLSAAVGLKQGSGGNPLQAQDKVIDALHDLLTGVGWSASGIKAQGDINYPFGFPAVGTGTKIPKGTAGCWNQPFMTLDGNNYTPYNPLTDVPDPSGDCIFFALGTTPAIGIANLAAAIGGRYTGSWQQNADGSYSLFVTAIGFGPDFNFPDFHADGRWGIGGEISGGGYTFTSVQHNNLNTAQLDTAQYSVKVYSFGSINGITSHITHPIVFEPQTPYNNLGDFQFAIDGLLDNATPRIYGSAGYVIVANPYSFAIFCPDQAGVNGFFICAPYIPIEEDFTSVYSMFCVCPGFNSGTAWSQGYMVCVGSTPSATVYSGENGNPRMLALRQPGTAPLLTPSGAPVMTNAWVMYGQAVGTTPYVQGKLWDCAIINDQISSMTLIDGKRYYPIASQSGAGAATRNTLLFRVS